MNSDLHKMFHSRIKKVDSGCWIWTGSQRYGDGRLSAYVGDVRRQFTARHAAWILYKGELPKGMTTYRTCGENMCVNPEHMKLVPMHERTKSKVGKEQISQMWRIVLCSKWVNDSV